MVYIVGVGIEVWTDEILVWLVVVAHGHLTLDGFRER